jgi:hypothetical protein
VHIVIFCEQNHLREIWTGMLHAVAQSESGENMQLTWTALVTILTGHRPDSTSYGQALVEVVAIVTDVYEMQADAYIPAGSLPLDVGRLERIKLAVVHDLISIAVQVLGSEAMSTCKLSFPQLVTDNTRSEIPPALAGSEDQGGTSITGALLHILISGPPATLSSDTGVQEVYLDSIDQLAQTLEGGSLSKRVLGNLTNTLATFCDEILPVRKRLWKTLGEHINSFPLFETSSYARHLRRQAHDGSRSWASPKGAFRPRTTPVECLSSCLSGRIGT